jgi:2-deoxy-D-gluconate 3-dehydrogenase
VEIVGLDLVAGAGINIRKRPEDFTPEEVNQVLRTNLAAVFDCTQLVYPSMKSRGGGKIILIGSMTSIFGFGISPIYSASKGAIVSLAKSLATAWGAENIQVNTILPGWIETDMTIQTLSLSGLTQSVIDRTPAGRWGVPQDFEGLTTFLASSASDFLTGTAIPLDGGFSSTLFLVDAIEN